MPLLSVLLERLPKTLSLLILPYIQLMCLMDLMDLMPRLVASPSQTWAD